MLKPFNVLGTGFTALLTFLFVLLKFFSVITWSWLWVFSPVWIFWLLATALYVSLFCYLIYIEGKENARTNAELKKIYGYEHTTK